MSFHVKAIFSSILFYLVLLCFFGYEIGLGDSVEFLGYTLNRNNPNFITGDLYISTMNTMLLNERSVFASVISIFSFDFPILFFCLHALLSIVLLLGLFRIAQFLLNDFTSSFFAIAFSFVFFYGFNAGANELYHNNLQGTTFSVAFGVWAIYCFLLNRILIGYFLVFCAMLFQPLEGFQLLLLCGGASIFLSFCNNTLLRSLLFFVLFLLPSGLYVWFLVNQQITGLGGLSPADYFDSVFVMRFPHHFIPQFFSKKGMLVLSVLYILALPYFYRRNAFVFNFLVLMGLGSFIYCIDLYFGPGALVKSWWFRSTIWLKLFGFIGVFGWLKEFFSIRKYYFGSCVLLALFCSVVFVGFYRGNIQRKNYHLGQAYKMLNPEIDICIKASQVVPPDAVFVHPLDFTALSYYGKRASYVSYKTIPRTDNGILLWKERLKLVYSLEPKRYSPAELENAVHANYLKADLDLLKNEGVSHAIFTTNHAIGQRRVVAKNDLYKIVEL